MELVLTIAVISILAAVMIPLFGTHIPSQLEATAAIVAADVDFARNLAVENGSSYRLTFVSASNQFYLQHVGTNAVLNALPPSAFCPSDPANRRTTDLNGLPIASPKVTLLGAESAPGSRNSITTLDFTSLGSTTRTQDTLVWLKCGSGAAARYISVRIYAATGITEIGSVTGINPALL